MLIYVFYLDKKINLVQLGIFIVVMNILVFIMVGLVIFLVMLVFNIQFEGGLSLLFIVLFQFFDKMFFGIIFYIFFFLFFFFVMVIFFVVMLEINVGNIINQDNSKCVKWSVILGILIFVFGIFLVLFYGVMVDVYIFGKIFFDVMDFLVFNFFMLFGVFCFLFFIGYIFKKVFVMEELYFDE